MRAIWATTTVCSSLLFGMCKCCASVLTVFLVMTTYKMDESMSFIDLALDRKDKFQD